MTEFDPRYPPTTNSLNRLRLEAAGLPDSLRGKTGYDLLSTAAIRALIQPYTDEIPAFYEQVALGTDWAITIAQTLGTSLGGLLRVLMGNDAQTQQANPDKPAAYWPHWSQIRAVYVGGGLVSGKAGEIITAQAQATLQKLTHEPGYRVILADHPRVLPLLGAARVVQAGNRASVLDFGSSYIKRATAHYTARTFTHLQVHEPLPNELPAQGEAVQPIFDQMVDILVQSYAGADSRMIPISAAAYVDEHGQPRQTQGGLYMRLAGLTADVPGAFSRAVSDRLGQTVEVRLLHDGTAAALYFAPREHAAVLMIGTALGSGYPVERPGLALCPVSPTLTVTQDHDDHA